MTNNSNTWFGTWFDSPYYHLLYQHRNDKEAEFFLSNLIKKFKLKSTDKILDIGCGKGRHARFLNRQGLNVTGIDLSPESIAYNKSFESPTLKFDVWDMRRVYAPQSFDVVLNLFTSFGYFDTDQEHLQTLQAFRDNLRPEGLLVLDFMNATKTIRELIPADYQERDNISFHIKRYVKDGYIFKDIAVKDESAEYSFYEKVRAFTLTDFQFFFEKIRLELFQVYGNYALESYQELTSDRLILVAKAVQTS